jgi:hypothetical protein
MQTNTQSKEKDKKQMISLLLIIGSILAGFFITMDQ